MVKVEGSCGLEEDVRANHATIAMSFVHFSPSLIVV